MKTRIFHTTILVFLSLFLGLQSYSQISEGGIPPSIQYNVDNNFEEIILIKPDIKSINEEDLINEAENPQAPRRMGVSVLVNSNMDDMGTWTDIEGVGSIWRVKLVVKDALALGVYYSDFQIPDGGKLFLYNHDKSMTIGAFTSDNNPEKTLFATEFIPGEEVILEYFKPTNVTENAIIEISEVAYAYRLIDYSFNKNTDSWWCMINVACVGKSNQRCCQNVH